MGDFSDFVSNPAIKLKNGIHSRAELEAIVAYHLIDFKLSDGENKMAFLMSLAGCESGFGRQNLFRIEPAYSPGGIYFQKSSMLKDAYQMWGGLVCGSYSAHQILYICCRELGYPEKFSPIDLWDSVISMPYVVEFLNQKIKHGADTIEKLFAVYNAGEGALRSKERFPKNYVLKAMSFYNDLKTIYI